jgi:hypothetical protein
MSWPSPGAEEETGNGDVIMVEQILALWGLASDITEDVKQEEIKNKGLE